MNSMALINIISRNRLVLDELDLRLLILLLGIFNPGLCEHTVSG